MRATYFSEDTRAFLQLLYKHKVKYMIVGGEAVIYYGYPRLTGDVDFFYHNTSQNTHRMYQVLLEFWEGDIPGLMSAEELLRNYSLRVMSSSSGFHLTE